MRSQPAATTPEPSTIAKQSASDVRVQSHSQLRGSIRRSISARARVSFPQAAKSRSSQKITQDGFQERQNFHQGIGFGCLGTFRNPDMRPTNSDIDMPSGIGGMGEPKPFHDFFCRDKSSVAKSASYRQFGDLLVPLPEVRPVAHQHQQIEIQNRADQTSSPTVPARYPRARSQSFG